MGPSVDGDTGFVPAVRAATWPVRQRGQGLSERPTRGSVAATTQWNCLVCPSEPLHWRNVRISWVWLAAVVVCLVATGAGAQTTVTGRPLSPYEAARVQAAFEILGGNVELEQEPEGKIIEGIDVVPLDVIEPTDPAPQLLNWFHTTTRPYVIEREVLLKRGAPYEQSRAYETERNLRLFPQLSAVLVVATKGSNPNLVRVLVITKDVWSLRLNWSPEFVNGELTFLSLQPSEINLFGTTRIANLNIILNPDSITTGIGFTDPRVGGSRIQLATNVNAVLDCSLSELQGATGSLLYGQPLYSTRTEWSWLTLVTWSKRIIKVGNATQRRVCSDGVDNVPISDIGIGDPDNPTELLVNDEGNGFQYPIRNEYNSERLRGQVAITRSYGRVYKYNLSFGAESNLYNTNTDGFPELSLPAIDVRGGVARPISHAGVVRRFEELYLPRQGRSEIRISPYVQLRSFANTFRRVINLETLGLAEDVRLGHDVRLRLYPGFEAVGSTRNVLGLFASAGYTLPVSTDGYFEALVAWDSELATLRPYSDPINDETDATFSTELRLVSPSLGFGRFVNDFEYRRRVARYLVGRLTLANTAGLRGYRLCPDPTTVQDERFSSSAGCFVGDQSVNLNLEFRSTPLLFLSTLWGAVLFYDAGDAFDEWKAPPGANAATLQQVFNPRAGAGVGLRVLIPQLDRSVFRVDLGFPLNPDDPRSEVTFIASFGQAGFAPFAAPDVLLQ